ncbi:chaperone NapD [Sulfurimonas sp. RIFOXYB12_FULL_35_9]|jgi:nitrate reductase NapD|uniref:chaperone NapD n=1 Tax=Sulfurimonas sp. RIFOXYB12_FULL_35_9 TaxID=1802256 RepID=UPI0008C2E9B2|nr:chaperone NapD [Sulfurimonas sp. RIFOXYB12_FULL_35_9]OHE04502.1 MAG: nitrate reductase [Sulfurimonas sp. RIFOXYB12_FULL_35_9]
MNISSIVVQTLPKYLNEVVQSLKDCEVCDYHMHDEKGRIIITIEGEGVSEELEKLRVIEEIPHVVAADMQMAYSEDELDAHMEVIANGDAVPKMLNDDTVDISNIKYNGDLRKKDDLAKFAKDFDKTER